MRKTLLLTMALCSMMGAQAKEITEAEAARIASEFVNSKMAVTRAAYGKLQLAKSTNGYYAYNRGEGNGFVVVAADDNMGSQVLGYADSGTLDFSNMPSNLKWWLSQYEQLATIVANNPTAVTRAETTQREAVEPLITCKWDQNTPYNDLCPEYKVGEKSATGCIATAMAQVMYYHKWPKQGTGSISYYWETGKKQISADFSQSTYDWDNMTDTYDSNSSTASKTAVAELMRDCGYATEMDYDSESGAKVAPQTVALVKYFNYDKAIRTVTRECIAYDEWHTLLYNELAAKRPILVGGGNHAFIFDGYKDGYYHVNWGWGGMSDGYFLSSELAPSVQGIGSSGTTYSADLTATIGIQKPVEGSTARVELVLQESFIPTDSVAKQGTSFSSDSPILNYSPCDDTFYLGLKVCKQGGTDTIYVKNDEPTALSYKAKNENVIFSLKDFPKENGVYNVYPVCAREGDETWYDIHVPLACSQYFVATVDGDSIYFKNGKVAEFPTVEDIKVTEDKVYAGSKFHVTATVTASNNDYCSTLCLIIVKDGLPVSIIGTAPIDLRKGESTTLTFEATAPSVPSEYQLTIASKEGFFGSKTTNVTVLDIPTGETKVEVSDVYTGDGDVDPAAVFIGCVLKCTSGIYQGPVYALITKQGTADGVCMLTSDESYTVLEGDSAIVTFTGSVEELEYGKTYDMYLVVLQDDEEALFKSDAFKITTIKSSGISGIANGGELQPIRIYTLNGKLVATQKATEPSLNALPKGAYIIKVGNNKAKKIINR